jgi:hypothetical protein
MFGSESARTRDSQDEAEQIVTISFVDCGNGKGGNAKCFNVTSAGTMLERQKERVFVVES